MNIHEYRLENSRLWALVEERNEAVDDFVKKNPDLLLDDVYEQFWKLQNEATMAIGKVQEFQANAKVTR